MIELLAFVVVFAAGFGIAEQCAETKRNREKIRAQGFKVYDGKDPE